MKYNELHRILNKHGCYETNRQRAGHPEWFSPITGRKFTTSNHLSAEVKPGTLKSIIRDSGVKI
ncbi:type II toxin-antitoxin system HicA family toxin [Parabacteroides goldsteinii]|uniref:type II toxin-antitoxin system HicA family toxin n=1 Tax=Parabacteroides goldsteinii TaxID=328812 RepID=UPI002676DEEF|nr:type II toxin-antitoxin system HicA family toxin [Parabacteroides goldsteinii]